MDKTLKRREFIDLLSASMAALAVTSVGCAEGIEALGDDGRRELDDTVLGLDPLGQHIAMLVYPGLTMLDLVGPHTCFSVLGMNVHLVWKTLEPVTSDMGIVIEPTTTFAQCPKKLEILFVPGSMFDTNTMVRDEEVMRFVRSRGERAKLVTSVCTGSMILGAAGLLRGYKATSHWATRDLLSLVEAVPVAERYVEDRNRITGAGVTSGLDFGLRIIARLRGQSLAETTQLTMEYAPEPPFAAGTPETAPAISVAAAVATFAPQLIEGRGLLEKARANF